MFLQALSSSSDGCIAVDHKSYPGISIGRHGSNCLWAEATIQVPQQSLHIGQVAGFLPAWVLFPMWWSVEGCIQLYLLHGLSVAILRECPRKRSSRCLTLFMRGCVFVRLYICAFLTWSRCLMLSMTLM